MKSGFYVTTSSVVGPRRSCKHFPESSLHKNRSWSLFGGLLLVWSIAALWIQVKPLYLRSMLNRSIRFTENCSACSQLWSTEWTQFFSMKTPTPTLHNQQLKSWMNWTTKFCLICHFTWPLANWQPFLQASWELFTEKMLPQPAEGRKCLLSVRWILTWSFTL